MVLSQICSFCVRISNSLFLVNIFVIFGQNWYFWLLLENPKSECFQIWYANTLGGSLSDLLILCQNLKFSIFCEYFCNFWSKLISLNSYSKLQVRMHSNLIYKYFGWFYPRFVQFVFKSQNLYFWWIFSVKIDIFDFFLKTARQNVSYMYLFIFNFFSNCWWTILN